VGLPCCSLRVVRALPCCDSPSSTAISFQDRPLARDYTRLAEPCLVSSCRVGGLGDRAQALDALGLDGGRVEFVGELVERLGASLDVRVAVSHPDHLSASRNR
jgi:hypothetical protein